MVVNQEGFRLYLIEAAPIGYGSTSFPKLQGTIKIKKKKMVKEEDIINDLCKMPMVEMHGDCLVMLPLIVEPNMIDVRVLQVAPRGLGA